MNYAAPIIGAVLMLSRVFVVRDHTAWHWSYAAILAAVLVLLGVLGIRCARVRTVVDDKFIVVRNPFRTVSVRRSCVEYASLVPSIELRARSVAQLCVRLTYDDGRKVKVLACNGQTANDFSRAVGPAMSFRKSEIQP